MIIYKLIGFENYIIKDKIMYRKAFKTKDKLCKFKYIAEREIKVSIKNNVKGYYLVRNNKTNFYTLTKLKHRLKRCIESI